MRFSFMPEKRNGPVTPLSVPAPPCRPETQSGRPAGWLWRRRCGFAAATERVSGFSRVAGSTTLPGRPQGSRPSTRLATGIARCRLSVASGRLRSRSDETSRPTLPPTTQWLSGDWYLAPPVKTVGNQSASRALALKLVQLVAADADTREIEDIFRRDPLLAYHLLRLVNSLGMGPGKRISSFSQAILILGRQQLKRWLNLLLFAASKDDHRSAMLLAHAGVRARSMELLANAAGLDKAKQEQAFMAGMFSLLGVLFGLPLAEILQPLRLADGLSSAVLEHKGETGQLLLALKAAAHADSVSLSELLPGLQISPDEFNRINIKAHRWILGVIHGDQDMAND